MEMQKPSLTMKLVIILCIIGFCIVAYFMIIFPFLNRNEGDLYFAFTEVPANATLNKTIIHLEDKDFLNIRGLDVRFENGKISRIYFRNSQNPAINFGEFGSKFGTRFDRIYLEYKGVYYYAVGHIP